MIQIFEMDSATFFEQESYVALAAENGQAALELLKTVDYPCLLLVDLMMPVMNGWELLSEVKQQAEISKLGHQIVIMSAADDAKRTAQAEGAHFLKKPFDITALMSTVETRCRRIE